MHLLRTIPRHSAFLKCNKSDVAHFLLLVRKIFVASTGTELKFNFTNFLFSFW